MTGWLVLATFAGVLLGGPGWFLAGRAWSRRSTAAAFNAGAAAAGRGYAAARHFDVATDVQAGPLTTRQYSPVRERAGGEVPR